MPRRHVQPDITLATSHCLMQGELVEIVLQLVTNDVNIKLHWGKAGSREKPSLFLFESRGSPVAGKPSHRGRVRHRGRASLKVTPGVVHNVNRTQ